MYPGISRNHLALAAESHFINVSVEALHCSAIVCNAVVLHAGKKKCLALGEHVKNELSHS